MPFFVAMTYVLPPRMRPARGEDGVELPVGEDGRRKMEREPGSPTRPARAWELAEAWWAELADEDEALARLAGAVVREVEVGA